MESASSAARTVECEKCNADVSVEQLRDHMRMHEAVLCECGTVYELQLIPFHKNNCACPAMSSIVCSRCRLTLGVRTFNVERFFSREQSFCSRCNDQVDVDGWLRDPAAAGMIERFGHWGSDRILAVRGVHDDEVHYCSFQQRTGLEVAYFVWDCALVLGEYLRVHYPRGHWRGRRVIELGAGVGATAAMLAALGAEVVATDLLPELLEENVAELPADLRARVRSTKYFWGDDPAPLGAPFDDVIVSDCVYKKESMDALLQAMRLLVVGGAVAHFAYVYRYENENAFWKQMSDEFDVVRIPDADLVPGWADNQVQLFRVVSRDAGSSGASHPASSDAQASSSVLLADSAAVADVVAPVPATLPAATAALGSAPPPA